MPKTKQRRKYTPRAPAIPNYLRHKATGQGYARVNGRQIYFGDYDEPESRQRYDAAIARYLANNRTLPGAQADLTIVELCADYLRFAEGYYGNSSTMTWVREAIRILRRLYGSSPAAEFSPLKLQDCRQVWIERGLARKTVNSYVSTTKRIFKWASAQEKVPGETYQALQSVGGIKRGRTNAAETAKVQPVADKDIEAIRPFVSRQIWALVQLQLLTAARGGELVKLRPVDIDMEGEVWIARPQDHKLAYKEKARELFIGPAAQRLLRDFLLREPDAYLFSPREAERDRHAAAPTHRRKRQRPDPKKTERKVGAHYTPDSYRRCVARACEAAGIETWTPHRLRHNAATTIRREYGIEAAQLILGHANGAITEIYAERDRAKALSIVAEIG